MDTLEQFTPKSGVDEQVYSNDNEQNGSNDIGHAHSYESNERKRSIDDIMALSHKRKELLVFGWVRNNYYKDTPKDVTKCIESFSSDGIRWLIPCKKFQEMFATLDEYTNLQIDPARTIVGGFIFIFSVVEHKLGNDVRQWQFMVQIEQESISMSNDLLSMTAHIRFSGNICDKDGVEYIYDSFELVPPLVNLFTISANAESIWEFDDFEMLFEIAITQVKHHKMKIKTDVEWILSVDEMNNLKKEHSFISKQVGGWSIDCRDFGTMKKDLYIKPLILPKDVNLLTAKYCLRIEGDGMIIKYAKKGITSGYIGTWDHELFENCGSVKIVLCINITQVLCYDGVCPEKLWSEYGFVE